VRRGVKEQSHKHEMAAALRGDFARLRARGVAAMFGAGRERVAVQAKATPEPPPATKQPADGRTVLSRVLRRG